MTCDFWDCTQPGHRVQLPDQSVGKYCSAHELRVRENYALKSKHAGPGPWVRPKETPNERGEVPAVTILNGTSTCREHTFAQDAL